MPVPIEKERLEQITENYLESEGYEFVDLRIGGNFSNPVIEVYCDIEGGITAEDCGNIAKSLKIRLEAEGLLNNNGILIVSSPGLDRVLKRERDFKRFLGRNVKVKLNEPIGTRKKLNGKLKDFQDGTVIIEDTEEGDIALAPGRWKEIRLVPEYPEGFG